MPNNCHYLPNFNAEMVFTSEHNRFIIESYFRNSAFNNGDFFSDENSSLEFGIQN
jgi:hypothetical protein